MNNVNLAKITKKYIYNINKKNVEKFLFNKKFRNSKFHNIK